MNLEELKLNISEILVKHSMPTRQVAINKILALFASKLSQHDTELVERLKEKKEDGKQLPYGIIRTQRLRLQTLKAQGTEAGMQMAYEDGWNSCLDLIISLITENGKR